MVTRRELLKYVIEYIKKLEDLKIERAKAYNFYKYCNIDMIKEINKKEADFEKWLDEEIKEESDVRMNDKTIIKCDHRQQERCNAYSNGVFTFDCEEFDNCYFKQLKRKEQECEELKKTSCKFKNYCTCDIEKLLQTLTEIKEIAEREVKHAPDGETFARPEIKQILQKISECEVEND